MSGWGIKYTPEAENDLGFFIDKHPRIWKEIRRIMRLLAEEDDPRHPKNKELNTAKVEYDGPGWWRVYVGDPGPLWVRVVFTLIATRNGAEIEIGELEYVTEFDDPRYIEITDVVFREKAYGKRLRDRFKNYQRGHRK